MAAILWWRSWHGAPTDPKWMVVARNANSKPGVVSAVAWALFDYASQNTPRGSVAGFDIETYSVFSGFDEYEIGSIMNCMEDKKLIVDGMLSAWDKRQPKHEDGIERVTKWRKSKQNENVTDCYDLLRNVTESYTDKDKDKDKELIAPDGAKAETYNIGGEPIVIPESEDEVDNKDYRQRLQASMQAGIEKQSGREDPFADMGVDVQEFCRTFKRVTGVAYSKPLKSKWTKGAQTCQSIGMQPKDIYTIYRRMVEKGLDCPWPGSMVSEYQTYISKTLRQPQQQQERAPHARK